LAVYYNSTSSIGLPDEKLSKSFLFENFIHLITNTNNEGMLVSKYAAFML